MTGRVIRVSGLVQGVGFRPYVWRLANELGLTGWVRNDNAGVTIAVDGENVAKFLTRLPLEIPPLARIDRIDRIEAQPGTVVGPGFAIHPSQSGPVSTAIGPDAALCSACIADICDPANRRWRYAFTTCTHCGPRYTVSRGLPYDRAQTSLASFALCPACEAEYLAAVDRRFHAETTCCPACGPQLQVLDSTGQALAGDPIAATLGLLQAGHIVAIKGLGGFHLACDARNAGAVAELRRRKQREAKPFAVMALNPAALTDFVNLSPADTALFNSTAAPIVLGAKGPNELLGLAPDLAWLGVMRPATPLHLLLWHEAAGRPAGSAWLREAHPLLLVMTSANPQGEPLVIDNTEARQRLAGIADAFLLHDRDIVVRCDDSVLRATPSGGPAFIRRARGYTPVPIRLRDGGPTVLALGGYLKNSVCLLKDDQAFLSQHIGSLDNAATLGFLDESVSHLLNIQQVRPELIAHDLHPDFPSTHLAQRLAAEWGIPAIAVGHHHAHLGAVCAEHQIDEAVLGLAIDGSGLGPDGGLWGGELLRVDGAACQRLGHLHALRLPGGERAAREPWRMAISALHGAGLGYRVGHWLKKRYPEREAGPLLTLLARNLHCPPTSSLGRLFDAAAGLLGVRAINHYEGQAAMELESLAARHGTVAALTDGYRLSETGPLGERQSSLDFSPLLGHLADCTNAGYGAALFHATLAAGLETWLLAAVDREKLGKIVISGGCALNSVLMTALGQRLTAAGVEVLTAQQAPANDGGLALGQGWVARQQFASTLMGEVEPK